MRLLRPRETNLRNQISAPAAQHADRELYLTLATDVEGFLAQLHDRADTAHIDERQRVLRLLVKDVLIGPRTSPSATASQPTPRAANTTDEHGSVDTEGDHSPGYQLRWRRNYAALGCAGARVPVHRVLGENPGAEWWSISFEARRDVGLEDPLVAPVAGGELMDFSDRVLSPASRAEAVGARLEVRLEDRLEHQLQGRLDHAVGRG